MKLLSGVLGFRFKQATIIFMPHCPLPIAQLYILFRRKVVKIARLLFPTDEASIWHSSMM
jgi:hypothetical protein